MKPLPQQAQQIISTLNTAGFEAYAVGGSIRDMLLNRETKGWDFTTNARPEQILELFPDSFYDNQFGTVGVKIYQQGDESLEMRVEEKEIRDESLEMRDKKNPNNNPSQLTALNSQPLLEDIYEITTYRSEKGYSDRRHPDQITWGNSLTEDLSRRDFTINAIAYDGTTLTDPYEGQKDLVRKLVRTVGNPFDRFNEDALRMMRAVRFAAQLGFTIDPDTQKAIGERSHTITEISAERVRDELLKIVGSQFAADGILILKNTGLLAHILPELDRAFGVPQKSPKRHHIYDVGTHSIEALRNCPSSDPIVRLATLLHDIGKPATFNKTPDEIITFYNHEVVGAKIARQIAARLKLSRKQSEKFNTLIRWHQFTVDERQTDSAIRRFIRKVGKENLDDMLALRIGDRLGGGALETSWRLELFKKRLEEVQQQPFSIKDLKVNGNDVMTELNCRPGPIVGTMLNQLFAEVEAETLPNEREKLITRLKELGREGMTNKTEQTDEREKKNKTIE